MLFNSYQYILAFLPLSFLVYFYLNKKRLTLAAKAWLVIASLFFYGYWNVNYLPLLLISIFVNYVIGSSLSKGRMEVSRKSILVFGIAFNLLLLGYFKYTTFVLGNVNSIFGAGLPLPQIILPLAISFFTFQQIAYLVDSYRKETKEYNFINYALFVSFFPQLIAGPIVHHKELIPQFQKHSNLTVRSRNVLLGACMFSIGLFKKVVLADTFAIPANSGFESPAEVMSMLEAWTTSLSYTFQLYYDFSGYSDMAIGASLLFNIRLPFNFNSPYQSKDIAEFWRRWHITLGRFLRDYLYIPLGGNKKGLPLTCANLLVTFVIGGLWHGASWMFVIWGALHGVALVAHRVWQLAGIRMHSMLAWFLTFNFVNVTWIFFRSPDLDTALKIINGMFSTDNIGRLELSALSTAQLARWGVFADGINPALLPSYLGSVALIGLGLIAIARRNSQELFLLRPISDRLVIAAGVLGAVAFTFGLFSKTEIFLYFNF